MYVHHDPQTLYTTGTDMEFRAKTANFSDLFQIRNITIPVENPSNFVKDMYPQEQ